LAEENMFAKTTRSYTEATVVLLITLVSTMGGALGAGHDHLTPNVVVYPTGVFPTDHQSVQAAVDQGGVVLLKAVDTSGQPWAFNFGPPAAGSGRVSLTRDVTILGETVGGTMTTILGGNAPFFGFGVGVRSAFRGIYFNGPRLAAVLLVDSTGFDPLGLAARRGHPPEASV
jgi:hypothetical protein